ncbi:class I SAM-dependent methyltransferase [Candidatus Uhrbacteria bacterium]|nr:class I SAM-dependent methyltransferase [Candidatus Uhrbacteria bacterium]
MVLTTRVGSPTCTHCTNDVVVLRGVPRFVGHEHYAGSFGLQWNRHAKVQLDSTTGKPISRGRLFDVTEWPERMEGQRILEAGCGAGRFTEVLAATGAEVWSFDLSNAVEANFANHGHLPNVHIFQASMDAVPFSAGQFDRVLCLGVLQHTPDPAAAFRALVAQVRPGGHLAIDVYRKDLAALLQWKYVLRPITKRLPPERLYRTVAAVVPRLMPAARYARRTMGRWGARLLPIAEYSHLGLSSELNAEWSVLDTFDMLSPTHDHPQTLATVRRWFSDVGFSDVVVERGPNGIIGRGIRNI